MFEHGAVWMQSTAVPTSCSKYPFPTLLLFSQSTTEKSLEAVNPDLHDDLFFCPSERGRRIFSPDLIVPEPRTRT